MSLVDCHSQIYEALKEDIKVLNHDYLNEGQRDPFQRDIMRLILCIGILGLYLYSRQLEGE
jgi:hypothetical protein